MGYMGRAELGLMGWSVHMGVQSPCGAGEGWGGKRRSGCQEPASPLLPQFCEELQGAPEFTPGFQVAEKVCLCTVGRQNPFPSAISELDLYFFSI